MQNLNFEKFGIGTPHISDFNDYSLKIVLRITRIISDIGDWCEDGLSPRRRQEVLARRAVLVTTVSRKGQEVSLHLDAGGS